jgi:hypothetical protein
MTALRNGIGWSHHGDKPYKSPERSDLYESSSSKPHKWHQDPNGPKPKLEWAKSSGPAPPGRPLWER